MNFFLGFSFGVLLVFGIVFYWPEATGNYYDGWVAGQELCKATDETPINQPLPLAEQLRRKK